MSHELDGQMNVLEKDEALVLDSATEICSEEVSTMLKANTTSLACHELETTIGCGLSTGI